MTKPLTILLLLSSTLLFGQKKTLDAFFTQVRAGKYPNIPAEVNKLESASAILNALPVYLKDTTVVVRAKAAAIARTVGSKSKNQIIRTKAVQQLVDATRDHDSGNTGAALMYLTEFRKADFTKANKDSIHHLLKHRSAHIDLVMKLIGYLEMREAAGELRDLSQDPSMGRKERWTAMLALARMGDERAAEDILNRTKRMPVTDEVTYEIFPDLVYTRSQQIVAYLVFALNSDAKNCRSANGESEEKIPCAYRVMEMLAPVVEHYPLKLGESGDVETIDYPTALKTVRDWFEANKSYKVLNDKF